MVSKEEVKKLIEQSEKNIINTIAGNSKIQNDQIDKLIEQISNLNTRIETLEKKNDDMESKYKNIETRYKGINDKFDKLKNNYDDLKESLQFTQDELIDKKIAYIEKECDERIGKVWQNCDYLKEKNRKLEDRSRRNNLRLDGVFENEGETWQETEEKVKSIFKNKLGLEKKIEIERVHRMYGNRRNDKRPKTIILKLLMYKDKELILNNAKNWLDLEYSSTKIFQMKQIKYGNNSGLR